jgi:sn-glycerol 3-phosphate transport system substrate-binding protein
MFKEAGLPDRAPETWTEFKEFCKKLTVKDKRVGYAVQMGLTTAHWYFQAMLYGHGNDISDAKFNVFVDQATGVAGATYLQSLIKEGIAIAATGVDGAQGEFTNLRSGMHFGSTGSLGSIAKAAKFNVGVGFIPGETRRQVPIGGSVLSVMTSATKFEKDAAWKFIKYMTNVESNTYFVQQSGYMPLSKSAATSKAMVDFMTANPNFKVAVDQLQYVRPQASVMAFPKGTEIFRQAVEKLTVGLVDPATVMKDTKAALEKEYNENFK